MSVVLSISHSQWSVAADKILFPSIRLPDVICVELVLSTSQVAAHPATSADRAAVGAAAVL